MKKTILKYGLISGAIVTTFMVISMALFYKDPGMGGQLIGFGSMIIAFAFVFVGVKNYRDKQSDGVISFGKALKVGGLIMLISSSMYVAGWLIEYYLFIPDFGEYYAAYMLREAQASGASGAEMQEQLEGIETFKELYQNPLIVILFTYMEILVVGIPVAILSALILKRKTKKVE